MSSAMAKRPARTTAKRPTDDELHITALAYAIAALAVVTKEVVPAEAFEG
jgi:hypothetical protein